MANEPNPDRLVAYSAPWLAKRHLEPRAIVTAEELVADYWKKNERLSSIFQAIYHTKKDIEHLQHEISRFTALQQELLQYDSILQEDESKIDALNAMVRASTKQQAIDNLAVEVQLRPTALALEKLAMLNAEIQSLPDVAQGSQAINEILSKLSETRRIGKPLIEKPTKTTLMIPLKEEKKPVKEPETKSQPKPVELGKPIGEKPPEKPEEKR